MTEDAVMVLVIGFTIDRDNVVTSLDQAPHGTATRSATNGSSE